MQKYNANAFGSLSLHSRMAALFRSQSGLLDRLLERPLLEANQHISPLLGAIRESCKSILLLEREGLLNELTLIQRLFVQRIINCCYLLNAEKEVVTNYLSHPFASTGKKLQDASADAFLDFSTEYEPKESASPLALTLKQQAEVIAQKTGAPKEFFLVAIASVFPQSTEILAGSLYGTAFQFGVFHRKAEGAKDRCDSASNSCEELCTAFFVGVGLLEALFRIVAKRESIDSIRQASLKNSETADQLIQASIEGSLQSLSPADGMWERLEGIEASAATLLSRQLQNFATPFEDAYEAGVVAPTLKTNSPPKVDLRCAALMLKRALNDLRGVWVLLSRGYTSQSVLRILECVEAFARAVGYRDKLPDECRFAERVQRAREQSWEAFKPFTKSAMPVSIARSWFVRKYPPLK